MSKKLSIIEFKAITSGKPIVFYDSEYQKARGVDNIATLIESNKSFFEEREVKLHTGGAIHHFNNLVQAGQATLYTNLDVLKSTYNLK